MLTLSHKFGWESKNQWQVGGEFNTLNGIQGPFNSLVKHRKGSKKFWENCKIDKQDGHCCIQMKPLPWSKLKNSTTSHREKQHLSTHSPLSLSPELMAHKVDVPQEDTNWYHRLCKVGITNQPVVSKLLSDRQCILQTAVLPTWVNNKAFMNRSYLAVMPLAQPSSQIHTSSYIYKLPRQGHRYSTTASYFRIVMAAACRLDFGKLHKTCGLKFVTLQNHLNCAII